MVTFNLTFSDEEATRLFKSHGFKIEEREFTDNIPVYHNREEEETITCLCVIHPHTGVPTPLSIAFERIFYACKEQLFITEVDKLTVINALNKTKKK